MDDKDKLEQQTTPQPAEKTTDHWSIMLYDMLRGARKYWWVLTACVAVCATLGLLLGMRVFVPMYRVSATFTVETHDENNGYSFYYDTHTANQMALTFPYLLDSDLLMDRVKADLGVVHLNGVPSAETVEDSNLLTLNVVSSDPQDAYDILLAVMDNYPDVSQYVIGRNKLNIIDLPEIPTRPYNRTRRAVSVAMGVMMALLIDLFLLLIYALTRNTIRREEDIQTHLNVTCLGSIPLVIPKRRRKSVTMDLSVTNEKTGEGFIEGIRRVALYAEKQMEGKQVLLVTATAPGEGTTTIARNVALTYAQAGKRVLLLDGNLHQENDHPTGLENYLLGDAAFERVVKKREDLPLYVAACQKPVARRDGGHLRIAEFMAEARQRMDVIVIDAPTCQRLEQISPLLEASDAAIYVVRQDEVKIHRILACFEDLHPYDVPLLGCVFNGIVGGVSGYGYHYGYGYGYGYKYGYGYGYKYGYGRRYGRYGYGYGYGYGHRSEEEET